MDAAAMDWVYGITAAFLVVFFVVAEIVRSRRAVRGRFRAFLPDESPAASLLMRRAVVDLPEGESVEVTLDGCVLCQGRFASGDPVEINLVGDAYRVSIPLAGRSCGSGGGR